MNKNYKILRLFFLITLIIGAGWLPINAVAKTEANSYYQNIIVPAGETINDNFFRTGNQITVNGDIAGDAILIGNQITINGNVAGDVLAAASDFIKINGSVQGNVRVAALNVEISNAVAKNVNIAADTAFLTEKATVGWTLSFAANNIKIDSQVYGNVYGFANNVTLNSQVANNVTANLWEAGQLTLEPNAIIKGDLEYRSDKTAVIKNGATILGNTTHKLLPAEVLKYQQLISLSWIFTSIISLFSLLLVGTIITSLFSQTIIKITNKMQAKPAQTLLWGIVYLIVIPIALFIIAITIIGGPLALIGTAFYFILLYLSKIIVGTLVGLKIINQIKRRQDDEKTPDRTLIWPMMLGITIVFILTKIPVIGFLLSIIIIIWFLGSLGEFIKEKVKVKKLIKNQ